MDLDSFQDYNCKALKDATHEVLSQAKVSKVWVLLGSAHRLEQNKPYNCVYIINEQGALVDRYDKMFCAGTPEEDSEDLLHYSPGYHFSIFEIMGIKCVVLICHEYRYPELYRAYKKMGVQLMFHAYHAGNMDLERKRRMEAQVGAEHFEYNFGKTLPEITMLATMISYAANNFVWISCSNTSAYESCWPSMMVRPDGVVTGRLNKHEAGILLTEIDTEAQYYDSTQHWRDRAMEGIFHSGSLVRDPRIENRKAI